MKRICILGLAMCLCATPHDVIGDTAAVDADGISLEALEQLAQKKFSEGNAAEAGEVYRQYEKELIVRGMDPLEPDLLHNQAVAYYRAGALGSAMACMKQLNLVVPSRDITVDIEDLQRLIEHRVYQKRPNTQFVRGLPEGYLDWSQTHQFSEGELHGWLIAFWSLFFVSLGVMIALRRRRRAFRVLIGVSALMFVMTVGMLVFVYRYHRTDAMHFGVLTGIDTLRSEPVLESAVITDTGYVPGMTVREVARLPGWVKVECSDGIRLWVSDSEYYQLRGVGEGLRDVAQ